MGADEVVTDVNPKKFKAVHFFHHRVLNTDWWMQSLPFAHVPYHLLSVKRQVVAVTPFTNWVHMGEEGFGMTSRRAYIG